MGILVFLLTRPSSVFVTVKGESMGKTSQRKGRDGEEELANLLRNNGYHIMRGGSMTFGEVPDLMGLPGVHIEVKRVEKLNIWTAMDQAIRDAARFQDGVPTVFHRKNRSGWLVTMRFSDWIKMYKRVRTNDIKK